LIFSQDQRPSNGAAPVNELLEAENVSLRLLLAQAEIDARTCSLKLDDARSGGGRQVSEVDP